MTDSQGKPGFMFLKGLRLKSLGRSYFVVLITKELLLMFMHMQHGVKENKQT